MPVTVRDFCLDVCAGRLPASTGEFILISVVAEFHHIVDADSAIAIIVVIRLPDGPEAVHAEFPVIAEVPAERFDAAAVQFTAEGHAFLIGFACCADFVAGEVDHDLSIGGVQLFAAVAEVEVETTIRPEREAVDAVIVLRALNAGEEHFLTIGLQVTIVVVKAEDTVAGRNNDA